jgi:hypothetical protein
VNQTSMAVIDGLIDHVAAGEPGAGVGSKLSVARLAGRRRDGVEGAHSAAQFEGDGGGTIAEGALDQGDENDLDAGAGAGDEVRTVEGQTDTRQGSLLEVAPEVDSGLIGQVG